MFKKLVIFLFLFLNLFSKERDPDVKKYSEALGHIIGKHLEELDVEVAIKQVLKGIKDSSKKTAKMKKDEVLKNYQELNEKINEKLAHKNLSEAEQFLEKNKFEKDIISLEEGKIQYKTLNEGNGEEIKSYNTPIIRYVGKYLNGKTFAESEELITINETILGLQKVLIGMKKNEKRIVYIHPSLAFGKTFPSLNSLIIFEIEVIENDSSNINFSPHEIADIKNDYNTF
ncbi:MAG: hypothetical protein A2888_01310 [Chlamydiae bacterium RIFCSPLOWO2_01_FULL_28_7]|nr:MAG: hypothetical protein A2888_01310 [Chlamydiae bacterium RIFCSPLOWO2_01_FULL_28_7]